MKVPPVLIGFSEATVLGNQQALSNSQKELINTVNSEQRFITECLKTIFSELNLEITQFQPALVADPVLMNYLTEDEIRNIYFGLPPKVLTALNQNNNVSQ
jgi:hypothetical protein